MAATAGQLVSPQIRVNAGPNTLQIQPPLFGIIDATDDTTHVNVLWENLTVEIIPVGSAASGLDLISGPGNATVNRLLGTWVRRITGNSITLDPSGGTSREYDGKVVALYARSQLGSSDTPVDYCLAQCNDGTFIEDVASQFVADPTR